MRRRFDRKYRRRRTRPRFYLFLGVIAVAVALVLIFTLKPGATPDNTPGKTTPVGTSPGVTPSEVVPTPSPSMEAELKPEATENTQPSKFGFTTKVYVGDTETTGYTRDGSVNFPSGKDYTALEGVITYRGNNYRDQSSYGTANITNGKLTLLDIDKTTGAIGRWGGSACTGQPLVVKWPEKTRKIMTTLYDKFKTMDGFTEVIIPSLDGRIYFMELETGEKCRDPINTGAPAKGTASLDPRGYPIIYVGQGLSPQGSPNDEYNDMYFRAYSLIDGKQLLKFGYERRDPAALRKNWQAFDASPLIDAATDTLIEPGENGVLYTLKLNTKYDENAGTLTMNPGPMVKYVYDSTRNAEVGIYGMENSPSAWRNYIFFTDNIGMLQCVDLNTMELVYANDLENDSDLSMVLEEDVENQKLYLYTGCEFDDTVSRNNQTTGKCYARKIDALTGEIIWTTPFTVFTEIGGSVDGGILASPIVGKEGSAIDGLVIYTVSSVIKEGGGKTAMMVALDKMTGEVKWELDLENTGWTPSSPVPVYTEGGDCYIVQCLFKGNIKLIKAGANSAEVADALNVSEEKGTDEYNSFEATPVVYGNTIIVGSRSAHFFYLRID